MLLLVVLPLQSVAQLIAGVNGHRHLHRGAAQAAAPLGSVLSSLTQPLRALLDHLHAAQDSRLQGQKGSWILSKGQSPGLHEHGGVFHEHSAGDADVLEVGDPADDAAQGGAVAFLALLPAALMLAAGEGNDRPDAADPAWRDRVVAPPLTPPRG